MANISITGKATEDDPDSYWLNLYSQDSKWMAGEPGGQHKISDTREGAWLFKPIPDKGVYANDTSGNVVFFLRNLNPSNAKVGDNGSGHAYEKARVISWRIDSL